MGILHEMLAKIHLAHDNALALADPQRVKTEAHHGFFAEVADLVHALEARVESIEHALFGAQEQEAQPEVAQNTGSGVAPVAPAGIPASDSATQTTVAADAAPSSTEPSA